MAQRKSETLLEYRARLREYHRVYARKWRAEHREYHNAKARERNKKNRARIRAAQQIVKREVFAHYGNHCSCPRCPEPNTAFLTIHHLTKEGRSRDSKYGGVTLYAHLKRLGFPLDVQLMCFNCNCGIEFNGGICPHMQGDFDA